MAELASTQRYALAGASLARSSSFTREFVRAQGRAAPRAASSRKQGDFVAALALLAPLRNNHTNAGRQAIAQIVSTDGVTGPGLVGWVRSELPLPVRRR